jgi:hypothetical protein
MKVVVILLSSVIGLSAAACSSEGAPAGSAFMPYYGPGSPPRESLPPEPEPKPEAPDAPGG